MIQKHKARTSLIIGILLISIYPVLVKSLNSLSVVSAFYRMFICVVILSPIIILKRPHFPKGKTLANILLCGVFFGLDVYFWNLSIEGSSAIQGTLLTNLSPIFVGVFSFLFLPNKPRFNFWIGAVIAIIGMAIFVGWQVFISLSFDLPLILGIFSAIFYAIYILLSKKILDKSSILPFMFLSNIVASVILGILNYKNNVPFMGFTDKEWILLIVGGLFCHLIAWYLISYATKHMRATRVSLSLLSQIIFATLLANLLLSEEVNDRTIIGGLIIFIGIGITFIEKPLNKTAS